MRYRLRTLMIMLAVLPPLLWYFWVVGRILLDTSFWTDQENYQYPGN